MDFSSVVDTMPGCRLQLPAQVVASGYVVLAHVFKVKVEDSSAAAVVGVT